MDKSNFTCDIKADSKDNIFRDLDGKLVRCIVTEDSGFKFLMAIIEKTGEIFILDAILPKKKRGRKKIEKQ